MATDRYLSERAALYVPFFSFIVLLCAVILLLPYETVYIRDRTYLSMFLVVIVLSVFVFSIGTLYNFLMWMRGKGMTTTPERRLIGFAKLAIGSLAHGRLVKATRTLLKDALYLSKLKDRSVSRWFMHLMILGGFIFMFILDLIVTFSLDVLRYQPMIDETGWAKLWLRDFGFDLVGFMMLIGLVMACIRRSILKPKIVRTELPDAVSILFLLAVVLGGFILEGMGIAGGIPGHDWLVHGVMSALLIAYIPFSKLFHMIATPIAIEAEQILPSEVSSG
ncbi:MAG: hypothetical protein MUO84_06330 [Thermoplasmata archaeon]|nr:hypothetical protein [Thermoplasmata archaeon]